MLNVDGWTDGRMNGRKLARLCLPAKAGATKMTKAPHASTNAQLQLLLENSKLKKGHNYVKLDNH